MLTRSCSGVLFALVASACIVDCNTEEEMSGDPSSVPVSVHPAAAPSAARHGPAELGEALGDTNGAHLSISLRVADEDGLTALLRDQQDPSSPYYHRWLTPEEYGDRFGLPQAKYTRIIDWLAAEGFEVTRYPNRLFVEAVGNVRQVRSLLGIQLRNATHNGKSFRSHAEDAVLPDDIAPHIAKIGGLDTRTLLRHRATVTYSGTKLEVLGAGDLRTLYDIPSSSAGAAGLTVAVLGTQEGTARSATSMPAAPWVQPNAQAIQTYFTTQSGATATYNPIGLPNPDNDFDTTGSNSEFELDVEMQSVGAPNAHQIDLVLSPASVVLQAGAQYIVNTLRNVTVVSMSFGLCESDEVLSGGAITDPTSDAFLFQHTVRQGLAEGQTWFSASGDSGADGCNDQNSGTNNGYGGGNATAEFPCSLPEIVCVGGTMFNGRGSWSSSGDLTGYVPEVVCNEGANGVAAGGGQSMLFTKPTWQQGVGSKASDGRRDLPDISLTAASGTPGVVVYTCGGTGQDACTSGFTPTGSGVVGGTSVSSPLAAGFFASVAHDVGCTQGMGDIHSTLYALGAAQQDGGAAPFHDITSGNNSFSDPSNKAITGFTAGPGYDLASGWGSLDVAKLIASWPHCSSGDGGVLPPEDSGSTGRVSDGSAEAGEGVPDSGVFGRDASASGEDAAASAPDSGGNLDAEISKSPDASSNLRDSAAETVDAAGAVHDSGTRGATGPLDALDSGAASDTGPSVMDNGAANSSSGCSCNLDGREPSQGWLGLVVAVGFAAIQHRRRRPAQRNELARAEPV